MSLIAPSALVRSSIPIHFTMQSNSDWPDCQVLLVKRVAPSALFWGLHVGIFVVGIPSIQVAKKLVGGLNRRNFWKVVLRSSPPWVRCLIYIFLGYAVVNFIVFMMNAPNGGGGIHSQTIVRKPWPCSLQGTSHRAVAVRLGHMFVPVFCPHTRQSSRQRSRTVREDVPAGPEPGRSSDNGGLPVEDPPASSINP